MNCFYDPEADYGSTEPLIKIYAEYLKSSERLHREQKRVNALSKLSGEQDEFAKDPMHNEFYRAVQQEVQRLSRLLESGVAGADEALIAVKTLLVLDGKPRFDSNSILGFGLVPVEQYATGLFQYLPGEALPQLYSDYAERIGRHPLPLQKKVLNEIANLLHERKLTVPEQKSLFRKLFSK